MLNHSNVCTLNTAVDPVFSGRRHAWTSSLKTRETRGPRLSDSIAAGERTRLIESARRGNERAWQSIVELHHRLVWWMLGSYSFDHATQEDIYQTVWCRLAENLDKIREPERLPAWLATTTRNEALKRVRYEQRIHPTDLADFSLIDDDPTPEEAAELDDQRRSVLSAFKQLDDVCRELLVLCTTDPPLGYEEIAEVWGRPIGSIGPSRARCLDQLRKLIR